MANSAFDHSPTITVPGSSTNTALVRWSGTGANTFLDSTILVGATTMGLAADTDLITFGNGTLTIGGTLSATLIAGAAIKDEDNMASDSATHLASQQSIKAYVDAAGGTTINGTTDNAIITYINSSGQFQAEANLKFDGTNFGIGSGMSLNHAFVMHQTGTDDEDGMTFQNSANNHHMRIKLDSSNAFVMSNGGNGGITIDTAGNVKVSNGNLVMGTNGKGIDFSASTHSTVTGASMENELLDDYEEGTWTPYYAEANTNANTTGQSVAHGRYTKIGRLVIATFRCIVNSLDNISTSTDGCVLMGLPFTAASGTAGYGGGMSAFHGEGLNIGTDESVSGYTENGAALVTLKVWAGGVGSAGGGGAFTIDHLTVDGGFIGTVTYFSAT